MSYTLRKAITSEAKPLIGLYSESGGGKTSQSLRLAKGFAGSMVDVWMIETESGRGEAWADDEEVGGYSVIPLRGNFSPREYGGAIAATEKAGAKVLIVDSASHEWEGVGGVLAMASDNQAGGSKGPLVWQKPKMEHQREFMLRLTQTPIPLVIVCMRAKYVMEEVTTAYLEKWRAAGGQGKPPKVGDWARSKDLSPKQSEDILYEMFVHGWLDKEHAFHGTKYTLNVLRQVFIDGQPITIETGKRLAAWAAGRPQKESAAAPASSQVANLPDKTGTPATVADFINPDAAIDIDDKLREAGIDKKEFLEAAGVTSLALLPAKNAKGADSHKMALRWIEQNRVTA